LQAGESDLEGLGRQLQEDRVDLSKVTDIDNDRLAGVVDAVAFDLYHNNQALDFVFWDLY
jgi:hypothetical protein